VCSSDLKFGNHEAALQLVSQIAYRKDFGGILADGSRSAAAKIGKGSERFAMHIKGLELPGYDPRGLKTHGLSFATAYTGADHNRGYSSQDVFGAPVPEPVDRLDPKGKGRMTKWNQDMHAVTCDCATMCNFIMDAYYPEGVAKNTADMVNAVTGFDYTAQEVEMIGERISNIARVFNVREGFDRKDDTFPERILTEPLKAGASKDNYIPKEELNMMLDEYYSERKWTPQGVPTKEILFKLGLDNAITELEKLHTNL
jgi:aldehyde:ferredoxin oxidoreductase